jgi:DNA-binding phage protein
MEMPKGLSEKGKQTFLQMTSEGGQRLAAEVDKAFTAAKKRQNAKAKDLKRTAILEALAAAASITEAAELAGVSRKTIYSYMNGDPEFITAYRDMKRGQVRDIAETINRGAEKAAAFIAGLLDDKEAPASVKLTAAVKLLEIGARYREAETAIDGATLESLEGIHILPETSPL